MYSDNILVTGANGQLGRSLRREVHQKGWTGNWLFTDAAELDITDNTAVARHIAENDISVVVNCAAYTNVDKAEDDREAADLLNNVAVANIAAALAGKNAVFIHVSTDYVFDGESCIPYKEDDAALPCSVYGITKKRGEDAILKSGCRYMIFRTAWLYSEYGRNFVKTMHSLISSRETVNVVFDQVGTPTYAADLADAICKVICSRNYEQGIYHYSNEGVCSWYDFAKEIAAMSGYDCKIQPCHSSEFPSKVRRPHYSVLDKSKVRRVLGLEVPYWRDSLKRCMDNLDKADKNQ